MSVSESANLLIIDGMNLFIRNFVVVPMMDANGNSIGGLTGFLRSMKAMIREVKPDLVFVVWDGEGGSRKRRGIFADYKAGRKVRLNRFMENENPEEQVENFGHQLKMVVDFLPSLGVIQLKSDDNEADDIIAFISRFVFSDNKKIILTSDRDMLQLVDSNTSVFSPTKKLYYTPSIVKEKTGVIPENYIYVKAMVGDPSDNISGIDGIGEKVAPKLFPQMSERPFTIAEIKQEASLHPKKIRYKNIIDNWDHFLKNIELMQLSLPIISATSARNVRTKALTEIPSFSFSDVKLKLSLLGIQALDSDFMEVFHQYKLRTEKVERPQDPDYGF